MPLFHAAGIYTSVFFSSYFEGLALGLASKAMTADTVYESLLHSGADAVLLPPSVMEDMAQNPAHVEALKKLKFIYFGGGKRACSARNDVLES